MQSVYSRRRGARQMEHVGSAHDERELEALKAVAAQRLAGGQQELELDVDAGEQSVAGPGPLPIVASRIVSELKLVWHGPTDVSDLCLYTVDDPATGKDQRESTVRPDEPPLPGIRWTR